VLKSLRMKDYFYSIWIDTWSKKREYIPKLKKNRKTKDIFIKRQNE
jgi:hypothetical protein